MATVLDYSAGVPQAAAVRDAGYDGAVRYISPPRADWMRGKPIQVVQDVVDAHGAEQPPGLIQDQQSGQVVGGQQPGHRADRVVGVDGVQTLILH